jgi:hypothetical protein
VTTDPGLRSPVNSRRSALAEQAAADSAAR